MVVPVDCRFVTGVHDLLHDGKAQARAVVLGRHERLAGLVGPGHLVGAIGGLAQVAAHVRLHEDDRNPVGRGGEAGDLARHEFREVPRCIESQDIRIGVAEHADDPER